MAASSALDSSKGVEYNIEVILARRQARRQKLNLPDDSQRLASTGPATAAAFVASLPQHTQQEAASIVPPTLPPAESPVPAPPAPKEAQAPVVPASDFRSPPPSTGPSAAQSDAVLEGVTHGFSQAAVYLMRGVSFKGALLPAAGAPAPALQPVFVWLDDTDPSLLRWVAQAHLSQTSANITTIPMSSITGMHFSDVQEGCRLQVAVQGLPGLTALVLDTPTPLHRQQWAGAVMTLQPLLGVTVP